METRQDTKTPNTESQHATPAVSASVARSAHNVVALDTRSVLRGRRPDAATFGLRAGDIIFGNRLSWMQRIMNVSGDYLGHCGIVAPADRDGDSEERTTARDEDLRVIELGPSGVFTRTIEQFVGAYRFFSVGRLRMHPRCIERVVTESERRLVADEMTYSMAACTLLEAFMLARRYAPERFEEHVNRFGVAAADRLVRQSPSTDITCSGFVYECVLEACELCRPQVTWPTRRRVPPWQAAPWLTDVVPVRAVRPRQNHDALRTLLMPYDLWAALPFDVKFVVRGDTATVIHDHFDDDPSPISMPIAS